MDSNRRSDSDREWTEKRIHRRRPDIRHSRRIPQSLDRNEHLHPLDISGRKDRIDSVIHMNTMISNWFCYTEDCSGNQDDFGMTRDIHHLKTKARGWRREDHRATYGIVSDQDRSETLTGNGIVVYHLAYRNTAYTADSQYLWNTRRSDHPLRWNFLSSTDDSQVTDLPHRSDIRSYLAGHWQRDEVDLARCFSHIKGRWQSLVWLHVSPYFATIPESVCGSSSIQRTKHTALPPSTVSVSVVGW